MQNDASSSHVAHRTSHQTLYYAIGGGLGHLTRAQAVIHTLNLKNSHILTAIPNAQKRCPHYSIIQVPPTLAQQTKKYQQWLQNLINQYQIQQIYLDTFPFGIIHEWLPFLSNSQLQFHYIARHLQFNKYIQNTPTSIPQSLNPLIPQSLFSTHLLEPLTAPHQQWIQQNSHSIQTLKLQYPPASVPQLPFSINWQNTWLIVHSQPQAEVLALLQYAQQKAKIQKQLPDFLLLTNSSIPPSLNPSIHHSLKIASIYPAYPLFPLAKKIIIAGGFNSIHQTQTFAHKRYIVPFPRRYDNQFWRAKHFSKNQ